LVLGASLVVFGALLLVIFKVTNVLGTNPDLTSISGNVATGVLGIGAALLPGGAAAAASSRVMASLPAQPATGKPVVTGITATPEADGATVAGHIITRDDGFWFVQYGDKSGDYQETVVGGRLAGRAGEQDISMPAPISGLTAGKYFRVGFTTSESGQTSYSKENRVP
jgi:hypothetical protein